MLTMVFIGADRDAWEYYTNSVAMESGGERITLKASYYMENGTPPGIWAGHGLAGIGLEDGQSVDKDQLAALFGEGHHPITGAQLGRRYETATSLEKRIQARLQVTDTQAMTQHERDELIDTVTAEELDKPQRQSIAGFELVFSPPKSVSAWWALADPALKDAIREAHHAAIAATITTLETNIIRTRTGVAGVAQETIHGISAALFDHWDTRAGDPQLHTHMLLSNRVQGTDGKWRTIDSRYSLSPAVATAGAFYDTVLMDELSTRFGVEWTTDECVADPAAYRQFLRDHSLADTGAARHQFSLNTGTIKSGNVHWQIQGVPALLNKEFSSRSTAIKHHTRQLIDSYTKEHGHAPSAATLIKMRQAATIRTRRAKGIQSLKDLTSSWRSRATPHVGETFSFAERISAHGVTHLRQYGLWSFRGDDITQQHISDAADLVLHQLGTDFATWRKTNAEAFALRAIAHWRFRCIADRDLTTSRITEAVINHAQALTPPTSRHTALRFTTAEGQDAFAPVSRNLYSTREVWDAEERLLDSGRNTHSCTVDSARIDLLLHTPTASEGRILSKDQAQAVSRLLSSGREVDILVGPAGAGKTTSLEKLREIWEDTYGRGSVIGLAPSAAAAENLSESLGIPTENTAKWLTETMLGTTKKDGFSYELHAGDLLIVDEASLAGTIALDSLRDQVHTAGAKMLLVGDWAQTAAVDAGGSFGLLARDRADVAELTSLHRFRNDWEKTASIGLRLGKTEALQPYIDAGRIHSGLSESILTDMIDAWKADESITGEDGTPAISLLIASHNQRVTELNQLARTWRIEQGLVDDSIHTRIDGGIASVGDRIVARKNNRRLRTNFDRWVKNNDEFVISNIRPNGDIVAISGEESVILPAEYAAEFVQLAYATTAHRAQGRTVNTAHTLVDSATAREIFYVGMTRGRHANHAYIVLDEDETAGSTHDTTIRRTWREILENILGRENGNLSAHESRENETHRLGNIGQLANEYHTLIAASLEEHYLPLLQSLGIITADEDSPYLGPVLADLGRLETTGANVEETITTLLNTRETGTAESILAVLHHRLEKHVATNTVDMPRIAGLIEAPPHITDKDTLTAVQDRILAIRLRAEEVLDIAIAENQPWISELGEKYPGEEETWRTRAVTVACYRDLYNITSDTALGNSFTTNKNKQRDRAIAASALNISHRSHINTAVTSSKLTAVQHPTIRA